MLNTIETPSFFMLPMVEVAPLKPDTFENVSSAQIEHPKPLVIFHSNCQDGFTAAWACWLAHPDWEFYPATHGNPPPDVTGRDVYFLDFSYKRPVILDMAAKAETITILDHHKSAKEDLDGTEEIPSLFSDRVVKNIFGKFDMDKSGASLAWEFFHPREDIPEIVRLVEDRDLWTFILPDTREVCAAIFSYPYDFFVWNKLHRECENNIGSLISQGKAIERKHHKDINELVDKIKHRQSIGGVEVWAANLPYTMASDAAHLMCYNDKTFAATYYDSPNGRTYSLRSKDDGMDVSVVAGFYGGGGHKHAAGFRLSDLDYLPPKVVLVNIDEKIYPHFLYDKTS